VQFAGKALALLERGGVLSAFVQLCVAYCHGRPLRQGDEQALLGFVEVVVGGVGD